MVDDADYSDIVAALREGGMTLPDSIVEGAQNSMPDAFKGLYSYSTDYLQEVFSKGIDISTDVTIDLKPIYSGLSRSIETDTYNSILANRRHEAVLNNALNRDGHDVTGNITDFGAKVGLIGHADGGIFTQPHVAWIAENGPEAAIPLDGSDNAISLWNRVGLLLGVLDGGMTKSRGEMLSESISGSATINNNTDTSSDSKQFVFAPKITIEGNADRGEIDSAISMSMEQFKDMLEQCLSEQNRRAFSAR